MPERSRRILFALNEPGYFRFYGPTIVELERRGWDVSLVNGKPEKRGPDLDVPVTPAIVCGRSEHFPETCRRLQRI